MTITNRKARRIALAVVETYNATSGYRPGELALRALYGVTVMVLQGKGVDNSPTNFNKVLSHIVAKVGLSDEHC